MIVKYKVIHSQEQGWVWQECESVVRLEDKIILALGNERQVDFGEEILEMYLINADGKTIDKIR